MGKVLQSMVKVVQSMGKVVQSMVKVVVDGKGGSPWERWYST